MKKILLFIFAITLFQGVLIAQKTSKAEVARQLMISGKEKKAKIDISTAQVPQEGELKEMKVTSETFSSKTGLTHLYFQQQINQIPVHNGIMSVHVSSDNQLFSYSSRFVKETGSNSSGVNPSLTAEQAVEAAAKQLGYDNVGKLVVKQSKGGPTKQVVFAKGSLSQEDIPVSLVWQPVEDFLSPTHAVSLRLAWDISIYEPSGNNWWSVRVDANTGNILDKGNWVTSCNFGDHDNTTLHSADVPHVHSTKLKRNGLGNFGLPPVGDSYNVYPEPLESPYDGVRQLKVNPADPTASPYGWHDINGVAGAEYTTTQGNNTHAYTDVDANNSPDPGSSPDGGALLNFDFPIDFNNHPSTFQPALVTNLFYWNNYMHDFSYKYGFDEANGNFQVNNYGKGGLGNDHVRAEAQDGSGTNNANFSTPPDGNPSRMQMFLWISNPPPIFNVTSPVSISGNYTSVESGFSTNNKLHSVGPVSGEVVYYNDDAGGTSHLACGAPANTLTGKIALIDRGTCGFTVKTKNAQNAGAIAVIVVNNIVGSPGIMGGTDNTITIPAVMISISDGAILKAELANTVNVTLTGFATIIRDSDLDNGIIAHEYAHGISNRLTGGPANVGCLQNVEQMGEGWSDYFTLMTTMKPGDVGTTPRGIGNYSLGTPANGGGIRPQPYSTNQSINNSTYNTIKNPAISQPHGIGFVWATMLWEMTWALIDAHGQATGFDESMNLVMEGMKLQPCSPGFVDGRDAILAADQALYGGANACLIWKAFAKRGLGVGATQGNSSDRNDGTEAYSVPEGCPGLSVSAATGEIVACPGVPSVSPFLQQFTVTGLTVTTAVDVNAPANFEVSTNAGSGFASAISIPSSGGNVPQTIVYVRSSATAPNGAFAGNVIVSTTGYGPIPVAVNGFTGAASSATISLTNTLIEEGFSDVTPLPAGWAAQNLSTPGLTNWFQGNTAVFEAQNGAPDSYIGANFNNTTGSNTISNWLFTPNVVLENGATFSFWTRTAANIFPDRLEVRMSTNGASTDVGASDISTGDFSTLLLSVNPDLIPTGYPMVWTKYTATISGLFSPVSGRIAFRYFVTNGGPSGDNSDYIGIDNVVLEGPVGASCDMNAADLIVDIVGGVSPYSVDINVEEAGQAPTILSLTNYVSGTPVPVSVSNTTVYSIASVTDANACSGVGSSNTATLAVNEAPLPVISATPPGCPNDPVTLSFTGAISIEPCTNDEFGKWPFTDYSFSLCDGYNLELITDLGWAGEYSVVNVEAGKFYSFLSLSEDLYYIGDEITITDITGTIVYSAGVNYVYFSPGFTGKIRFYTHESGCAANDQTFRLRVGYCTPDVQITEGIVGQFFSWSPGGATTSSITVNPAVPTNYSLTFRNPDLWLGLAGCEGTSTKQVVFKSNFECGLPSTWYRDADGDGYGNPAVTKVQVSKPRGFVLDNTDCRDFEAFSFPGADEIGDGIDNDCDGLVDEGLDCLRTWYYDGDGDGYGSDAHTRLSCKQHNNFVLLGGDCKNWDPNVYPGKGCPPLAPIVGGGTKPTQPKAMVDISTEIQVFPNPARNEITVTLNGFETGKKLDLSLMQADGKPMMAQSTIHTMQGQQVKMDVKRLSSGYYLLKASQGSLQQIKKVMIIR